jgi:hypothetical protein
MLFNAYIRQEHFRVPGVLSSDKCMMHDAQNGDNFDLSFVKGVYLQEELREKEAFPEDLPHERAVALGLISLSAVEEQRENEAVPEDLLPEQDIVSLDDTMSEEEAEIALTDPVAGDGTIYGQKTSGAVQSYGSIHG